MATVQRRTLIVLDGEDKTGAPDRELARGVAMAYFELRRRGVETVFACDGGGFPLVAEYMRRFSEDPVIAGFLADHIARSDIADALSIEQIVVDDFDAVAFFPIDAADLGAGSSLKSAFLDQGKTVVIPDGSPWSQTPDDASLIRSSATDLEWINQLLL
ncbi:MAG: hypothetical protein KL863_26785 [Rhizobium sp.]|nr:hypothetical protein [Rhizobium sp.]